MIVSVELSNKATLEVSPKPPASDAEGGGNGPMVVAMAIPNDVTAGESREARKEGENHSVTRAVAAPAPESETQTEQPVPDTSTSQKTQELPAPAPAPADTSKQLEEKIADSSVSAGVEPTEREARSTMEGVESVSDGAETMPPPPLVSDGRRERQEKEEAAAQPEPACAAAGWRSSGPPGQMPSHGRPSLTEAFEASERARERQAARADLPSLDEGRGR